MASRYRKSAAANENHDLSTTGGFAQQSGWPAPEPSAFHQSTKASVVSTARPSSGMPNQEPTAHNPKSSHFGKRYACTFKGCGRRFDEKASLAKHKDSEHDYCVACDLDFDDDEALHVHKMQSSMHIICPICGIDFKSEPGRDRHAKQMHSTQQNVTCRGCHKLFQKGAGLLQHFEQNQCAPLTAYNNPDEIVHQKQMLEAQRALMAMELSMQQKEEALNPPWISTRAGDTEITSQSAEGGVRLQPSLMDDPVSEHESRGLRNLQPALIESIDEPDAASVVSSSTARGGDAKWPAVGSTIAGNWPVLGTTATKPQSGWGGSEPESSRRMSVQTNSTWSNNLFPDAPATPASAAPANGSTRLTTESLASVNPSESGIHSIPAGRLLQPDVLDNVFHCPFPKCEDKFMTRETLISHMKDHRGSVNQCPCCFRYFKAPSALTAHMESNSTRCKIRETRSYGNAISLVSGGFLAVEGKLEDGTARIDSQKKPDSFW